MTTPPNLLVASSERHAQLAMAALGLDPVSWMAIGAHSMVGGRRFDKIVVLPFFSESVTETQAWAAWVNQLRCRLRTAQSEFIVLG